MIILQIKLSTVLKFFQKNNNKDILFDLPLIKKKEKFKKFSPKKKTIK